MNQQIQQGMTLSDRYTLLRELSSIGAPTGLMAGTESTVWLARDEHSGDEVAIRILAGNRDGNWISDWALVAARKSSLAALVHPHILRTLDMGGQATNRQPDDPTVARLPVVHYIVCTYVDGLHTLHLDPANPGATTRTLMPILDALDYAHSLGIVHGAISSRSLVEDKHGVALLSGFGSELLTTEVMPINEHLSPQILAKQTPQVSDDVYAMGTLLYFIFTGNRWTRNTADNRVNSPVPEPLRDFIATMLSDSAYDRPQQIRVVKAKLEGYLDPSRQQTARPIEATAFRKVEPPTPVSAAKVPKLISAKSSPDQRTVPVGIALSLLAALVVILLGVFLYQPGPVDLKLAVQNGASAAGASGMPSSGVPSSGVPPATESAGAAPYELARLEQLQDEAKTLAAKLLREQITLEDRGALLWAAEQLKAAQALADQGDTLFRDRQFSQAIENYRQGISLLEEIAGTMPAVLAAQLTEGKEALAAGNAAVALRSFSIASAIDPDSKVASAGLRRANSLDALGHQLTIANELEKSGSLPEALSAFNTALGLDPESGQAKQGADRVDAEIRQRAFNKSMSSGFTALQAADFPHARQAFTAAQQLIPGSPLPADGLNQVDIADRLKQIEVLQGQAERHAQEEDWSAALADYNSALALDPNLVFAHDGIKQASERLELSQKLTATIEDPLPLRDEAALSEARDTLYQASMISNPGPVLADQIQKFANQIKWARVAVKVDFLSDQQTDIIVYKVKQLGRIDSVSLELFPGKYTAVGTRKGYRDTRQEFTVQPGREGVTVSIVCSDRI